LGKLIDRGAEVGHGQRAVPARLLPQRGSSRYQPLRPEGLERAAEDVQRLLYASSKAVQAGDGLLQEVDMRLRLLLAVLGTLAGPTGAPPPGGPAATSVTFNREIARLLQQHCQECHRPGGSAPFELIKYEHVYRRRDKILAAVEKRAKPPWEAPRGYGEFNGEAPPPGAGSREDPRGDSGRAPGGGAA